MKQTFNVKTIVLLTTAPLNEVLQQCNQQGMSPSADYAAWTTCLQQVFASRSYVDTASGFVYAINQVWGPEVTPAIMLSAVTGLTNGGQNPFTNAVVQPLINTLLATFLIRDNLADTGGQSTPPYWISPDIICYQQNALTATVAQNDYATDLNMPFTNGQANNFYIRAENISSISASGYVSLYAVPCSLLLTPQSWFPSEILTPASTESFSDTSGSATIAASEVCITGTPFTFTGVPSGGHFCMIAIASGANGMPFPIPQNFASNAAQAIWVETNPNVSQRNLSFQAISGTTGSWNVALGNNNASPASFVIVVTQKGSGASFPTGTTVSASITDLRAPYSPPTQTWQSSGISFYGLTVPGNINGGTGTGESLISLTITITLPKDSSFPGTMPISIAYYQIPSEGNLEEERLVTRKHKIPSSENLGSTEARSLILLGTCNFAAG